MVLQPLYTKSAATFKKTVLLVDGHNLMLRIFNTAATPTSLTPAEVLSTCVQRFFQSLASQVRKHTSTRIFIAFDNGGSARKLSLYSDYKGTREYKATIGSAAVFGSDDPVGILREKLIKLCRAFDLPVLCEPSIEGDDLLGIAVEALSELGQNVVVLSNDKDMLQWAWRDNVTLEIPYKKATVTRNNFIEYLEQVEKVPIHPEDYIMYKILAGDKGDNIPGIKGYGYKTAHKKIGEYLAEVPEMRGVFAGNKTEFIKLASERNEHKFEKVLAENRELLLLNLKLMELTSEHISSRCQSIVYKALAYKSNKPSVMDIMKVCGQIKLNLPVSDVQTRLFDFKSLYT